METDPYPDYVTCIRKSDHPRDEYSSLCGRKGGFVFTGVEHAMANRIEEGRLICCPTCLRKAGALGLANGEEALIAEVQTDEPPTACAHANIVKDYHTVEGDVIGKCADCGESGFPIREAAEYDHTTDTCTVDPLAARIVRVLGGKTTGDYRTELEAALDEIEAIRPMLPDTTATLIRAHLTRDGGLSADSITVLGKGSLYFSTYYVAEAMKLACQNGVATAEVRIDNAIARLFEAEQALGGARQEIDALREIAQLHLTNSQRSALFHCARMDRNGWSATANRQCTAKTMRQLEAKGLVTAAGLAVRVDGDGYTIQPERWVESWKLTDAGRKLAHYL